MSGLAGLEDERKAYQEQLDIVLGQLRDDPENAELKVLQGELNELVAALEESIAELKPKQTQKPAPASIQSPPRPEPEKWSRENHPAFKKTTTAAAAPAAADEKEDTPVTYQVNDMVQAKWLSGDKGFYPARITSITGSATDPIYIVKFKSYDNTETLRARDIRPNSNKRKADGLSSSSAGGTSFSASTPTAPGVVSSAGATMYLDAKKDAEQDGEAKPKAKKIKAKKELERGKSKWQEFNSKGKFGKTQKKDSMFRTPEGVHGRVGFTGSGQAMRKDPTRNRHVYEMNEELD